MSTLRLDPAIVRDAAHEVRARKLAAVLDERFDAFGEIVGGEAVESAAIMLDQIEAKGCRLIFVDDVPPEPLRVERPDLHAQFARMVTGADLPWSFRVGREAGVVQDANGEEVCVVDVERDFADTFAQAIAIAIVLAVNTCGGFRCDDGGHWVRA